jgi:S1-C subfamily serine protease
VGFNAVYEQVLPSVVNIQVVKVVDQRMLPDIREFPLPFPFQVPDGGREFRLSGLGSGFVWDQEGHIITNNHVVDGADEITVTFYDGTSINGEVVGSDRLVTIDDREIRLGGDVIVQIDSQPTQDFEDLTAYLARSTEVGQTVSLTVLRGGRQETLDLTLGVRPTAEEGERATRDSQIGTAWLGITGLSMSAEIAEAMDLPFDQSVVLIQQVVEDSPADQAGLRGSYISITINGQQVLVGGDIIVALADQAVEDMPDLQAALSELAPEDDVSLTILRDGDQVEVEVTLGERP